MLKSPETKQEKMTGQARKGEQIQTKSNGVSQKEK